MTSTTDKKIIAAASICFSKKGFCATSIADIAHEAGISQGAMYRHFRSKDELIIAIVKEESENAQTFYGEPYQCSALERILQITESCIMKNGAPITPPLWIEIIAESSRNEEVNRYYLSADIAMREALKNIIKTGISNGEFQSACTEEMSILLFAILDGLIARRAVDPNFNIKQSLPSFQRSLSTILNPGDT